MKKSTLFFNLITFCGISFAEIAFLTGGEIDTKEQSYSYVGLIWDKGMGGDSKLRFKAWADYLTYSFPYDRERVEAKAPAFQLAMGIGKKYSLWSLSLWTGWERRNTRVDPPREVEVKGIKDSLILQFEVEGNVGKGAYIDFITSYSSGTSYFWSRARLRKKFNPEGGFFGIEFLGHGNKDYRAFQSGPVGGVAFNNVFFLLKAGFKNSSQGNSFYGGAEFFLGF